MILSETIMLLNKKFSEGFVTIGIINLDVLMDADS